MITFRTYANVANMAPYGSEFTGNIEDEVITVRDVLKMFGIMFFGIAMLIVYISLWVWLWEISGWPGWIFILVGIGTWFCFAIWLSKRRRCEECGMKNMKVLDTVYDEGYALYDHLLCRSCGHSQKG